MIEHLRHSEIDKTSWDRSLAHCANRSWYAQSWVLDAAAPGWDALVDLTSGAMMPLTWRRKFGIDYLYQPYGIQQLGAFAPKITEGLQEAFLRAIPPRFRYWDICLNTAVSRFDSDGCVLIDNVDQELLLTEDAVSIRSGYSENHRRNVRKANGCEAYFTDEIGVDEFVSLFERTTGARFGSNAPRDMRTMRDLIAGALSQGQCVISGIRREGVLHAAVSFMVWHDRVILFKSASDPIGQEQKAVFYLVDRMIGEHSGMQRILDFAGSNTPSVARFNAGFGARSSVYLRLRRNLLPVPFKWFKQ